MTTEATAALPIEDWAAVNWRLLEHRVYRLQTRIYRAERRGNVQAVRNLQRLMMKSWAARMLAVRRVTQDNQGKRTAGIDGVKALRPAERLALAHRLRDANTLKAQPVRRVYIPKPGKNERRPLGIPTMQDRAHQALVKLALEPQWEARFEPNSYGFRPGRSAHDAVESIWQSVRYDTKWVLDADIQGCFDHIDQRAVLAKLDTPPALRRAIRAWLRAGVMEGLALSPTRSGTPQGGVISPLLANIALTGLEEVVGQSYSRRATHRADDGTVTGTTMIRPKVVRYADDFVILCHDRDGIEAAQRTAESFLATLGLRLNPAKSRIVHTLEPHGGRCGFDFLGFTVRQYPAGRCHTGRSSHGAPLGYQTHIVPSKDNIKRHLHALKTVLRDYRHAPQATLIRRMGPLIVGWTYYYRSVAAARTFQRVDHEVNWQLVRWCRRRHPGMGPGRAVRKYFQFDEGHQWTFTTTDGPPLPRHPQTKIRRHIRVRGHASPFDGNLAYWSKRLRSHPMTRTVVAKLLKRQDGRCPECGLLLRDDDLLEVDHIDPTGGETYANKQVLHRHGHDVKTARDRNSGSLWPGLHDKDGTTEEPDDPKGSRPVLQGGGRG
jgi:RNA-directed DNA polymerase